MLKLKDCGFLARMLKTVKTYLQNRRFHTIVNGSGALCIESGVSQDSVLGSVLFRIYIRDISKLQDRRVFNAIYADDTTIAYLAKIEGFFCTWGLKINPRKTQAIVFTGTLQELQQKITVARTEIEWSGKIEYLELILDQWLTLSEVSDHPYPIQSFIPKRY
ncbi:hypothetical protein Trydic_g16213 [Trypoxylus dichotomus]